LRIKLKHLSRSSEARKIITDEQTTLNNAIVNGIQDVKGKNIVVLDLRKIEEAPTDFFIVCEGESNTQIKAIADRVQKSVKEELFLYPSSIDGLQSAKWICIDYFDTIVHIFYPETREFYKLEDLWSDALFTEYHSY